MLDCVVIGMGPAGIASSIYLTRYGLDVLVIGKDLGALTMAKEIENYYAHEKISGKELAMKGLKSAIDLGVKVVHDEVISIDFLSSGYSVKTTKQEYETKTIMIATGKVRNSFPLAKKYEGKGVSYCATCDGFFYKKKKIGIVGYNEFMLHELNYLLPLTSDITVFTNGNELSVEIPEGIILVKDKITALDGNNLLDTVICGDNKYSVDGLFIALGSQNAFTLAKHLGLEIKDNNLVVDENFMTNIPGIFAGGDVIGGLLQVVKAASDGAIAANSINKYIREQK